MKLTTILIATILLVGMLSCTGGDTAQSPGGGGNPITPCIDEGPFFISGTITVEGGGSPDFSIRLSETTECGSMSSSQAVYNCEAACEYLTAAWAGTCTITPTSSKGYTFTPSSRVVVVGSSDVTGQNFTASP